MQIGTEDHKRLFCESFLSSHARYDPEKLPFPALDDEARALLARVPFWDEALHTERRAARMLQSYADQTSDGLLREALSLQAREEARHGQLIAKLLATYSIPIRERTVDDHPTQTGDLDRSFVQFGYGECFDSFFAFGLHRIISLAGVVPEALSRLFDPVLDEEARHIVFFVNFVAFREVQQRRRYRRAINSLRHYVGASLRRLAAVRGKPGGPQAKPSSGRGFTATGASAFASVSPARFLSVCLEENERRMSGFDPRLLRPRFLPVVASWALRATKMIPGRSPRAIAALPSQNTEGR